jgi:hypothetical protein
MNTLGSRRLRPVIIFFLLFLIVPAACRQSTSQSDEADGYQMSLVAVPAEAIVGPARLLVTLNDAAGVPVDGAAVEIRGDMAHAGMVPVLATAIGRGSGQYEADFEWTMAGDWFVTVTASLNGGGVVEREFPIRVGLD